MYLFFLQLCFHISGIFLLISLMEHHAMAFSYLSIFILNAEVFEGNGPSCLGAIKPQLCLLLQDALLPDSYHPCANTCTYYFLHDSQTQQRSCSWKTLAKSQAKGCWRYVKNSCSWGQTYSEVVWRNKYETMVAVTAGEIHWLWLPAPLCQQRLDGRRMKQEASEFEQLVLEKCFQPRNHSAWSYLITTSWCVTQ